MLTTDVRRCVLPFAAGSALSVPAAFAGGTSTGLVPITELGAASYMGFQGGLYLGGSNTIPAAHAAAAMDMSQQIVPRDGAGNPSPAGKIVMIAIGMSNTTHEFAPFERQEDLNIGRNARLLILDTAFGGQTASEIANPAAPYWTTVANRVVAAGGDADQVQVAWLKEANANPTDPFPLHAQTLQGNLEAIARNLHDFYPNLKIVYLSSRIYGGYAGGPLNPEPYAYEGAFSVKWAIENQINGDPGLNYDPDVGPVEAPLMLWGPYLWADGLTPRMPDGLTWALADFEGDGTHPAPSGEQKVADLLSGYFNNDPIAAPWWEPSPGATLRAVDAIADAIVDSAAPTTNFGSQTQLMVSSTRRLYLKFDVSAIDRPLRHAKLSLRVIQGGGGPVGLVSDTSWSENAVTWNTAPAIDGSGVVNIPQNSRDGTIAGDVTGAVNDDADGVITFALTLSGAAQAQYFSKEGGQPPRLILSLVVPPDCPGNANGDGVVSFADITFVLANFGNVYPSGNGLGDANHNGVVDFGDVTSVLEHWGDLCP